MNDAIEIGTDSNGEVMIMNTPANLRGFARLRCSTQDVQRLMDKFLYQFVRERIAIVNGEKVVTEHLARRVDVAVKGVDALIKHAVEEEIRRMVGERVRAIVDGMTFDVSVRVMAKQPTNPTT